ncbi:MAG: N-acetylmuramoyl-L-alanine amidase [Candidatus Scatovivens sp.]
MKRVLKIVCIIPIVIGIVIGIIIGIRGNLPDNTHKKAISNIVEKIQKKEAEVTKIYVYGTSLNVEGKISGISKDNLEGAKLVLTDGFEEILYKVSTSIEGKNLIFEANQINNTIDLEKLQKENYYILLRLKLNNSTNYKYYNLTGSIENNSLEYFTITNKEKNNKISVQFSEREYKNEKYKFLTISKTEESLPENIYDIVIDAGHGGTDLGEKSGEYNEADITLDYAQKLGKYLTDNGLKVKLTRTEENNDTYNYTNMYDVNGRITVSCESRAKYMISLHINNDSKKTSGFEIYAPCKCDLELANLMSNNINTNTSITFSSNNLYKQSDGVYVKNFTKKVIEQYEETAKNKGYEPYLIDIDTPYLYTIREVGGIATNAYVDGRNTSYSANKYYNSNFGIECYQIELGYIKTDLEKILSEQEEYIKAIADAILTKCNV